MSRVAVVARNGEPFPTHLMNRLHYNDTLSFSGNTFGFQDFRGNSTFDPNETGAGHQPYGRDQLATLYGEYLVHAAKLEVQIANLVDEPAYAVLYSGLLADLNSTALDTLGERPGTIVRMLPARGANTGTRMKMFVRTKWMAEQEEKEALMGDDWDGSVGANPTRQWGFRFVILGTTGNNIGCVVNFHLTQWCEWYQNTEAIGQS